MIAASSQPTERLNLKQVELAELANDSYPARELIATICVLVTPSSTSCQLDLKSHELADLSNNIHNWKLSDAAVAPAMGKLNVLKVCYPYNW
mgnify:CR=1 FL=1